MTSTRTRLEIAFLILGISLFIFFAPYVLGSKEPAIEASVKQNMDFLNEMAKKYTIKNKRPPATMDELINEARKDNYNKTLFNPIFKNSGDAIDRQIVEVYPENLYRSLGPEFQGRQYAGKTGYYADRTHYAIYGHLSNGELMKQDGKILVLSNS